MIYIVPTLVRITFWFL